MPNGLPYRLTISEFNSPRTVEFYLPTTEDILKHVESAIDGDAKQITLTRCRCDRDECCTIHKTHTSPHKGCILR